MTRVIVIPDEGDVVELQDGALIDYIERTLGLDDEYAAVFPELGQPSPLEPAYEALSGSPPWAIKLVLAEAISREQLVSLRYKHPNGHESLYVVHPVAIFTSLDKDWVRCVGITNVLRYFELNRIVSVVREADE